MIMLILWILFTITIPKRNDWELMDANLMDGRYDMPAFMVPDTYVQCN